MKLLGDKKLKTKSKWLTNLYVAPVEETIVEQPETMKVNPPHPDVNLIKVEQENVVFDNAQSIEPNVTVPSTKDNKSPISKAKGEKESSQNDRSAKPFEESNMFELDDEDYTILHRWKSYETQTKVASEPNANQPNNVYEYQEVWDQFRTTFHRVYQDLKYFLSLPDV